MNPETTRLPEPPPSSPMSTGLKVFIGVGAGCLVVGLLGMGACGVALWWAISPGQQTRPATFIDQNTVGAFGSTSMARDAGAGELITHMFTEVQRIGMESAPEGTVPGWLRRMQQAQMQQVQAFGAMMPRDMVVLLERNGEGPPAWLAVINLSMSPRLYGLILRWAVKDAVGDQRELDYRGQTILELEPGVAVCFLDGTILISADVETMKRGVDRALDRGDDDALDTPLASRFEELSDRWTLFGVFENTSGELFDAVEAIRQALGETEAEPVPVEVVVANPERKDELLHLELGMDIISGGNSRVMADLELHDEASARAWADTLERYTNEWTRTAGEYGLSALPSLEQSGTRVFLKLDLAGVDVAITRWLEDSAADADP